MNDFHRSRSVVLPLPPVSTRSSPTDCAIDVTAFPFLRPVRQTLQSFFPQPVLHRNVAFQSACTRIVLSATGSGHCDFIAQLDACWLLWGVQVSQLQRPCDSSWSKVSGAEFADCWRRPQKPTVMACKFKITRTGGSCSFGTAPEAQSKSKRSIPDFCPAVPD
jgi:hypothetical protein